MKVLIVEDETAAALNLRSLLTKVCPQAEIVDVIESVMDAVAYFESPVEPDIVFMDIHLADGNAFHIFRQVHVKSPIIFTTAYDQYALDAFKVNSIDYILKPIKEDELKRALEKLANLRGKEREILIERVNNIANQDIPSTTSLLIHVRDKIIPLKHEDTAYFYTSNEKVSVTTLDGKTYPVDGSLDGLMGTLSESTFFRANRQFIISRQAIKDISVWFGSRLDLHLKVDIPEKIIISKARVPEFKRWLTQAQ